ncbi:hypothetical protein ACVMGC_003611 [Bradyrhizobium barranii subsp. barranii]
MRNTLKTVLFVAAFSPALISVGVARLFAGGSFWDAIYYVFAGFIGSLLVVYILTVLKWRGEEFPFTARKIESNDVLLLGVVVTYIFPFLARASDITVGAMLLIGGVVWVIFWLTDATIPSPLRRLFGYRFYNAESTNGMVYTLITRREIFDPREVKAVKQISGSMLLEVRAGPGCLDCAPLDLSGFLPGYAERGALRFCRCVGRA